MNEESKYIPLQEATKYCNYSQEYLSLRARQGKLRSVKFGRNWVTTKEWLEEYLQAVKEYNDNNNNIKKNFFKENLSKEVTVEKRQPIISTSLFSFTFVAVIIFILVFCGIIFAPSYFQKITDSPQVATASAQDILRHTIDVFEKYAQWVSESIKNQLAKIKVFFVSNFIEKNLRQNLNKEGMVVIPLTQDEELMREKIKKSFSDEVEIKIQDDDWGIIKPIFREPNEQEYLYIMVPLLE